MKIFNSQQCSVVFFSSQPLKSLKVQILYHLLWLFIGGWPLVSPLSSSSPSDFMQINWLICSVCFWQIWKQILTQNHLITYISARIWKIAHKEGIKASPLFINAQKHSHYFFHYYVLLSSTTKQKAVSVWLSVCVSWHLKW